MKPAPFTTKAQPAPQALVAAFVEAALEIVRASELATSSQRAIALRVLKQHGVVVAGSEARQ